MHRGCFVWTPTPPHFDSEDATPGSRACVCVRAPLGWVGWAGLPGVLWCTSSSPVAAHLCAFVFFGPLRAGVALFVVVFGFFFPCGAPVDSVIPCLPSRGALFLGVLWYSCPAPSLFFYLFVLFVLFSLPPPGSFFFFPSCFLFVCCPVFFCFFVCLGVPILRCLGLFVCPALWGVLVCVAVGLVPRQALFWACAVLLVAPCLFCVCCCLSCGGVVVCFVFCPVLCGMPVLGLVLSPCCCPLLPLPGPLLWPVVVFSLRVRCCVALALVCCAVWCCLRRVVLVVPCCFARAGWCCVLLHVVAGCSLLGLVACCCFPLACVVAVAPAWPRGPPPRCVLWFVVVARSSVVCPVFCGALLLCGAVLCRPAVRFPLLVVLVCVLSLCVRCCDALRVVLFGAVSVCAVVVASCCGVSLCVVVSPLPLCGLAVLLRRVVVSCCAMLCSVVLCRLVVPCCWGVLCVVLCCGCFFFL